MDIVKNIRDLNLNEDQQFFAEIIKDEFGCNTCIEEVKNVDFKQAYARPLNDFNIYTTIKKKTAKPSKIYILTISLLLSRIDLLQRSPPQ